MPKLSRFNTRYPFHPYSTGWFCVGFSDEVKAGEAKPITYLGQELVVYRTESGKAVVIDAHCPHLGAHLGHNSKVCGENIVCPFHQWEYEPGGQCVAIPFVERIPPKAKLKVWPSVEQNFMIFIWHDLDGRAPLWELPDLPEANVVEGAGFHGLYDEFGAPHPQDVMENVVDFGHFPGVHSTGRAAPNGDILIRGHRFLSPIRIHAAGSGDSLSPETVLSEMEAECIGPALTRIESSSPLAPGMNTITYVTATPVDETLTHYRARMIVTRSPDCPLTDEQVTQFAAFSTEANRNEQPSDGRIWPYKAYVDAPIFCETDGPIFKYRKWFSQFHPNV